MQISVLRRDSAPDPLVQAVYVPFPCAKDPSGIHHSHSCNLRKYKNFHDKIAQGKPMYEIDEMNLAHESVMDL